ncbi:hypothetical protein F7R91_20165 [Streptomyces luteolifulvus]|uniref:Uncharacterized protein n=1 Tax=Streptomyces luteolifulvus TaxID=2615112 RepID=A0A6H9UYD3_9ACTN|nr:hypothetical protein [Streptomyces luteolifulvus]KAB1144993.1 hypothetical protein F7R91_20165 [Streptomyces luteolifulvus]
MPYTPGTEIIYQLAADGDLTKGLATDILEPVDGTVIVPLDPRECSKRLPPAMTQMAIHQMVNGSWRRRLTHDGRMNRTAQDLGLAISRWERVPSHELPQDFIVVAIEEEGSCVMLIDEDECTKRL